jgi:para-nitrobenzyl esterase
MALLNAKTIYGEVSGVRCGYPGYTVFKGVPYATPPTGALRWAATVPPVSWEGVRVCDTFSKISVQNKSQKGDFYQQEFFPTQAEMSEDCLYLNIWTPAESQDEKLPVMVWIHGGAYMNGYGHEMEFDGEAFCKRGVILVTINYRLGVMGFLAHPEGLAGNYGLLDQIQALEWVRDNIAAFGGDAGNVTLFGQSAGGGSVLALCTSPQAEGLFDKAIIQSAGGVGTLGGAFTLKDAERFGQFITEHCGHTLDELRALPAEEVYQYAMAANMAYEGHFGLRLVPCTGGSALPEDPGTVIAEGRHLAIPYMTGFVSGDSRLFGQREIDWLTLKSGTHPLYVYHFSHTMPGGGEAFHSSELWYIFGTIHRCWRPMTGADYDLSLRMTDYWTNFAKYGNPNGEGLNEWMEFTETDKNIFLIE